MTHPLVKTSAMCKVRLVGAFFTLSDCLTIICILKNAILFCQACHRIHAICEAIMQRKEI